MIAAVASILVLGGGAIAVSGANAAPDNGVAAVCTPSQKPGVAHCEAYRLLNPSTWQGQHTNSGKSGTKGGTKGGGNPHNTTTTSSTSTTSTTAAPTTTTTVSTSGIKGYFPTDLLSAYNLTAASANTFSSSSRPTVAVIDAYNDPNALSDVNTYRAEFGIPSLTTCTITGGAIVSGSSPCFAQVNQSGGSKLPRGSASWGQEISLDVDMVSAICPYCNILLVEASTSSITNLGAGVDTASTMGAVAISNSYGASEFSSESSYDSFYTHSGSIITVSAGDGGYGVEYPAASPDVISVGGTSLSQASNTRGWTESVWNTSPSEGTGSGCSAYEANPGWQPVTSVCSTRTVADVSAVADPYTGVAVYDTYGGGSSGWMVFGGTSVASPIIASVVALAGNASTYSAATLYSSNASLYPVNKGSNTSNCTNYLCNAADGIPSGSNGYSGAWYNGPTGNGTPNGTSSF